LQNPFVARIIEHMIEFLDVDVAAIQQRALDGLLDMFADLAVPADDAACIDHLDALERIKAAAAAAQATITDQLDQRRPRASHRAAGRRDASLGAEIALARRESPHQGRGHLTLARVLLHDLPHTHAALRRGDLSERRAQIIATETRHLTREHRLVVDRAIADNPSDLDGLGDTRLTQALRRLVLTLDEDGALARRRRAHAGRRVTGRLLPDGMAQLSLTLADWQYAAVMTSLAEATESARATGDPRTRGQHQTDTAVARLTGQTTATRVPVALKVLVSAETLLGDDHAPAWSSWCGHLPATVARHLAATSPEIRSTVQRYFHYPTTGALVAMESQAARFAGHLREFVALRDQTCRTPWCNAPIRHADHVQSRHAGGPTAVANGQGLCESCNHAKETPGWRQRPRLSDPLELHATEITTPTGHRHSSTAPPPPVPRARPPRPRVDIQRTRLTLTLVA